MPRGIGRKRRPAADPAHKRRHADGVLQQGFATPEEAAFRSDLAAAVALLAEKCPEGYTLELPWGSNA